eukprot:GHUV01001922.1.p1 GENE.GHUV01001922.1~~GHUV01001922.1.p1  ORF type:complete len:221 (+),score=43.33 GHUV01001922.1:614-1276(+)
MATDELHAFYNAMTTNPTVTFRKTLVVPAGYSSSHQSSMTKDFALSVRKRSDDGTSYRIGPLEAAVGDRMPFTAAYLKMEAMTAAGMGTTNGDPAPADFEITNAAPSVLTLIPPADGQLMMLTGRLQGCTVCWTRDSAGHLVLAHLQPTEGLQGDQLNADVLAHGLIHGRKVQGAYGVNLYGRLTRGAVFGVWNANYWKVYGQQQEGGMGDRVLGFAELV